MSIIKWDRAGMKHVDNSIARSLELTAEVLRDDIREEMVVPRALGTLQGEAFTIDRKKSKRGIVSLIFNTPYARRLYYHPEYNFRKDQNPNAQGMWMVYWLKGGKYQNRAAEIFDEIIRRMV